MTILDRAISSSPSPKRESKKLTSFLLIIVLASSLMATVVFLKPQESDNAPSNPSAPVRIAYVTHSPILIDGDAGFLGDNSSTGISWGSGTVSDPYILENMDINASSANGIEIRDSDAHFIVRNCYVHHGRLGHIYDGIHMYNCANGTIDDNACTNNEYGIWLEGSSNNTLSSNTCISNEYDGIFLYESSNDNCIVSNTCTDSYGGIGLYSSFNNVINNNTCSGNSEGIYLEDSDHNDISYNNCTANYSDGISLDGANNNNMLSNNNCSSNAGWGMEIHWSSNNTLISNNCSSNGYDGIYLWTSSNNTLVSNRGFWNVYNGIDVVSSRDNMLVSNTWSSNGYHGAYIGYSTNNTLDSNNCSSNNLWGIQIRDSSGTVLLRNQICNNLQYGVYIHSASSSNIVFNNTFIGNNGAGSTYDPAHAQAYDEVTGNWWNSTDGYGNYWSDWITPDVAPPEGIVDVPYDIAGSAGAKDYYPQTTPQAQIPEFGMMPLVLVILTAIILVTSARRRKAL